MHCGIIEGIMVFVRYPIMTISNALFYYYVMNVSTLLHRRENNWFLILIGRGPLSECGKFSNSFEIIF